MSTQSLINDLLRPGVSYQLSLNERLTQIFTSAGATASLVSDLLRDGVTYKDSLNYRLSLLLASCGVPSYTITDLFTDGKQYADSLASRLTTALARQPLAQLDFVNRAYKVAGATRLEAECIVANAGFNGAGTFSAEGFTNGGYVLTTELWNLVSAGFFAVMETKLSVVSGNPTIHSDMFYLPVPGWDDALQVRTERPGLSLFYGAFLAGATDAVAISGINSVAFMLDPSNGELRASLNGRNAVGAVYGALAVAAQFVGIQGTQDLAGSEGYAYVRKLTLYSLSAFNKYDLSRLT